MEVRVDKFGRIVVPKRLRDQLGIEPGKRLSIDAVGQELRLRPLAEQPDLQDEGGVLVYFGKACGDLEEAVEKVRAQRYRQIMG